jgi:signal peptidase
MQPNIMVGDLVFVKNTNTDKLEVNDIIAFRDEDNTVTTHRIISVDTETFGERCFVTKGDSNNTKDEKLVCKKHLEGKMVKRIPKLGKFINFIQQPLGFIIMMLTIFIICILIYMIEYKKIDKEFGKMSKDDLKAFEEFKRSQGK